MAGVIGMDLLAGYTFRMDYSKKQMELILGSVKRTTSEPGSAEKLPLDLFEGHYRFAGRLDSILGGRCSLAAYASSALTHNRILYRKQRSKR
jgi:hypothetical protein